MALHKSIQDPKKFAKKVDKFIAKCLKTNAKGKDTIITLSGLALKLGCSASTLSEWKERYSEPTDHDPDCLISSALERLRASSEQQLTQSCYSTRNTMALALAKCMHGYVEQQHVKVEGKVHGSISVLTGVPDAAPLIGDVNTDMLEVDADYCGGIEDD